MKTKLLIGFLFLSMFLSAQSPTIEKLKEVVAQNEGLSDDKVLASIHQLFEEFYYRNDTNKSVYYAELLIEEAQKRKDILYERQGYINKAYTKIRTQKQEGKKIIDSIFILSTNDQQKKLISQCYTYYGKTGLIKNSKDTSLINFQKALDVLENDKSAEAVNAQISLSHATVSKIGFKPAIKLLEKALETAKALNHNILTARAIIKLAQYQYNYGNYEKSSSLIVEAIEFIEEQQYNSSDLIKSYGLLGDLYWVKNQDVEKARLYTKKAYELGQSHPGYSTKARTTAYYAYYFIVGQSPDLDFAKELTLKCLDIVEEHNLIQNKATPYFYLGMIYSMKDSLDLAYPHFINAIQACKEANQSSYSLRIQAYLAEELQKSDLDLPDFIDTSDVNTMKTLDNKIWFYRIKKDIALKNKDYQKAYSFLEKLNDLWIEEREEQCRINVEEQLLACQLEDEKEKTAMQEALLQTTNFKNRILAITAILATLLLGLFYFLYRTKRQHNKTILEKNEQISADYDKIQSLNQDLNSKNELLADKNKIQRSELVEYIALQSNRDVQLKSIREEIQKEIDRNPSNIADWQLVNNRIEKLIDGQNEWVHFKRKIESLYPDFFMDLLLKHSNLTEREQMHCAYVLLGMTVNQVAKTLFISPKSAESARYRLKKKIGLGPEESLSEYIQDIGMKKEKN